MMLVRVKLGFYSMQPLMEQVLLCLLGLPAFKDLPSTVTITPCLRKRIGKDYRV